MKFLKNWLEKHPFLFGGTNLLAGLVIGFGLGVYFLPILIEEEGLTAAEIQTIKASAERRGTFVRDLADSDAFHWGDGTIYANETQIWLEGSVSPGPDYRLYLTPKFVETEADFLKIKDDSQEVAMIKAFQNFRVDIPKSVTASDYPAVIIWCERFGQFITAATLE